MATALLDHEPRHASSITALLWSEGTEPHPIDIEAFDPGDGVIHFDVPHGADAHRVYETLRPICGPDLTMEMVEDLLEPDVLPKIKVQDDEGRIRAVSAFSVSASEPPVDADVCSGRLTFNLVEFLENEHWLVTCSHRAQSYAGSDARIERRSSNHGLDLLQDVSRRWVSGPHRTAGDLGVLFLHQLACSYSDAWREMMSWLDRWERRLYDNPNVEQQTLKDLRAL